MLALLILVPILTAIYGVDYWLSGANSNSLLDVLWNYILPALIVIAFCIYKSATPGKMAVKVSSVDAQTGEQPSVKQYLVRYLGYYVSIIPLFLGIIWVAFDKRKQGWHDKLAGTVVVKTH